MDSIRVDLGVKKLLINDGPEFIEFNPSDVKWSDRFSAIRAELTKKINELQVKVLELERKSKDADADGVLEAERNGNALRREMCEYMRNKIDQLFGDGTSQKVFGDLMSEVAIGSFLTAVAPFIQVVRPETTAKYMPNDQDRAALARLNSKSRRNKKVMQ